MLLWGCTSQPSAEPSPSPTLSTTSTAIGEVRAQQPNWRPDGSNWEITLTWEVPTGLELVGFVVQRNGDTLTEEVTDPTYVDTDAAPSTRYVYTVLGVDARGARTRPGRVAIKTKTLDLADARLQGAFVVHLNRGAFSGLKGTPQDLPGFGLQFDPACKQGACPVTFAVRGRGRFGKLGRDGKTYAGTVHGPFYIRSCHGGSINETLGVKVTVRAARPVGGQWRATAIEGSIQETAAASGCVTAHVNWTFKGRAT